LLVQQEIQTAEKELEEKIRQEPDAGDQITFRPARTWR